MKIYLANQDATTLYKIGISKNPDKRIKSLQTANSTQLKLIITFKTKWGYKLESALHRTYKSRKIQGEWFDLSDEDVSLFINECEKLENNFNFLKEQGNPFI